MRNYLQAADDAMNSVIADNTGLLDLLAEAEDYIPRCVFYRPGNRSCQCLACRIERELDPCGEGGPPCTTID